jgi:hypothetical protein
LLVGSNLVEGYPSLCVPQHHESTHWLACLDKFLYHYFQDL